MTYITNAPRQLEDGSNQTSFNGVSKASAMEYRYLKNQTALFFENRGADTINLTLNGSSYTIPAGANLNVPGAASSFVVQSATNVPFAVTSWGVGVDSDKAARVRELWRDPAGRLFINAIAAAQRNGTQINIHCAIDSLSSTLTYVDAFRPMIQGALGNGGLGFVAFNNTITTQEGLSYGTGGGSEKTNANFDPVGAPNSIYNPSLYYLQYTAASALSMDITDNKHAYDTATVYYLLQLGGGTFNWRDGNTVNNPIAVNTANATKSVAWATRSGWPAAKGNLVRASSITGNVHLIGADFKLGTTGCRVHRTAQPGTQLSQVAQLDGASYTAFLAQTGVDLYILNAGMNDAPNLSATDYETKIRTVLDWVRAANPQAAILLLLPNAISDSAKDVVLETYRVKLRDVIAKDYNAMVYDERFPLGSYTQAVAAGLMTDGIHPNTIGSQMRAEAIFSYLGGSALSDVRRALMN